MRLAIYVSFFLILLACSEPYEFPNIGNDPIDIVDGKVSTIPGRTYVEVYRLENNVRTNIRTLTVKVISLSGQEIDLSYNVSSNSYRPNDINFAGAEGEQYRLEITTPEEITYQSSYDSISSLIDFEIDTNDTTLVDIGSSNQLIREDAVAAIAIIPYNNETSYTKFEFSYSYIDYWTNRNVDVLFDDDFILYTNVNSSVFENTIDVPIGSKKIEPWLFYDLERPPSECTVAASCTDPYCGNPCCHFEETWLVDFKIHQEAVSLETYEFWENVEKLRSNDGLVFDTYPFPLEGNISCTECEVKVIGLFRAVAENTKIIEIEI